MNIRGQPQQDMVYISSFWLVCDPMNLMPAVVKSDSMDLLISVPIISGIAVEDGALVRPIEPPPLICSPEKIALPPDGQASPVQYTIPNWNLLHTISNTIMKKLQFIQKYLYYDSFHNNFIKKGSTFQNVLTLLFIDNENEPLKRNHFTQHWNFIWTEICWK